MILEILLLILMFIFIIYPIIVICHVGFSGIVMFWFGLSLIFLIWAILHRLHRTKVFELTPSIIWGFYGLIAILLAFIIIMSVYVNSRSDAKATYGAEYIIVIGEAIDDNQPANELKARLDMCYEYWKNNKDAIIIVSGGQADDETMARAIVMRTYLIHMGVDEHSIIMENVSLNTYESIINSCEYIESVNIKTVVVTSDYNAFHAEALIKNNKFTNVEVIAVDSKPILRLNYTVREVFSLIKDIVKHGLTL